MRRLAALVLTLVIAGCASATAGATGTPASPSPTSGATGLTAIGAGLEGPAGLAATVYATGLAHVSAFAFDADGRLWAATAGYSDDGTDAVYRVASPGAAPLKVIAAQHTPLGLVWSGDTLFVASAGRVDAYARFADGTFASHTTVLTLPSGVGEVFRDGQAWGFPACYGQGGSACAGTPAPVAVLDTHAAVSGVAIATGGLGASFGPSALVAEWASGVVLRVALSHEGTTYTGTVEPFLTGLTQPVPVVTAGDGSVFVGDWGTGSVYRIAAV